jgi:hypothetical protein
LLALRHHGITLRTTIVALQDGAELMECVYRDERDGGAYA